MELTNVYTTIVGVIEFIGAVVIVLGLVLAFVDAVIALARGRGVKEAVRALRNVLGGSILLGLEIFVAADLIRTITTAPTIQNMLSLGLIVLIRTVLSFTIEIEIDGVLPWRKALLTSGATFMAAGHREATRKPDATKKSTPKR